MRLHDEDAGDTANNIIIKFLQKPHIIRFPNAYLNQSVRNEICIRKRYEQKHQTFDIWDVDNLRVNNEIDQDAKLDLDYLTTNFMPAVLILLEYSENHKNGISRVKIHRLRKRLRAATSSRYT